VDPDYKYRLQRSCPRCWYVLSLDEKQHAPAKRNVLNETYKFSFSLQVLVSVKAVAAPEKVQFYVWMLHNFLA
jgi:hypothetical protein